MAPGRRSFRSLVASLMAVSVIAATAPASVALASGSAGPSLRLIAPQSSVTVTRYGPNQPVMLTPGILVAAARGAWEIRASRPDYDHDVSLWQHFDDGSRRQLPAELADGFRGLDDFFRVTLTDREGRQVLERRPSFCPQGQDMRVTAAGPMASRYPRQCGWWGSAAAFTLGTVWGIEKGWAVPTFEWEGPRFRGPDGRYTMRIAITPRFRALFGVADGDGSVSVNVRIRTDDQTCLDCPYAEPSPEGVEPGHDHGDGHVDGHGPASGPRFPVRGPLGVAPGVMAPPDAALPDLIALPAFGIDVSREGNKDRISFGANVWNAGPAPLLVEGFRREDEDVMDAYQYFLDGEEVLGRSRVGVMEFHDSRGHNHWHFLQFARYSLWDASLEQQVVAKKQAFCLAPTDAIDLTVPGAEWLPGSTGLGTSCGGPSAVWIRETLQAGWGDTYYQVSGQSLDVTNVPNGTYYIAVEANPAGLLRESDMSNNVELRKIRLGGTPGNRTVVVKSWHGIGNY